MQRWSHSRISKCQNRDYKSVKLHFVFSSQLISIDFHAAVPALYSTDITKWERLVLTLPPSILNPPWNRRALGFGFGFGSQSSAPPMAAELPEADFSQSENSLGWLCSL